MQNIFDLSADQLKEWMQEKKIPAFRVSQVLDWIYQKCATSWEEMTNLSKDLRQALSSEFQIGTLKFVRLVDSEDGQTTKFLWELSDGKFVEAVLIRSDERRTVCVSCQVGCPARCAFCASGKKGLLRCLSSGEIVEQVFRIEKFLKEKEERVSHIVFMGMGEPFENYDNVLKTIHQLISPQLFNLSQRRITVSTVGIKEKILKFADEDLKVNLVLSLHAPNQQLRQKIIPYARKYPLEELLAAMLHYSKKTKRDITYEYTLLAGLNDQKEHARELAKLVKGHPCTVNLIPYNPVDGINLRRPEKEDIEEFRSVLSSAGINTTWRYTKGKDIAAACGQLALKNEERDTLIQI